MPDMTPVPDPTAPDHSRMKLGKRHAVHDRRLMMLSTVVIDMPAPPMAVRWSDKMHAPLGMMLNDALGDCTCAAKAHAVQCWTANSGNAQVTVSDQDVLKMYEGSCHYNPANPASDQGGIMTEVITYWKGHPLGGHTIVAAAAVSKNNKQSVKDAIWLFGGCDIGLALPVSAQTQAIWAVPPQGPVGQGEPGSWGGHDVFVTDYDARALTCITWGGFKKMTWPFWFAYCDEAYAYLSREWCEAKNKVAPSGVDWNRLIKLLNQV